MGGLGSGRREYATTPTVEECRHLDTDRLTDLTERPGQGSMIYWGGQEDPDASIRAITLSREHVAQLKEGETLRLHRAGDDVDDPEDADQVEVDATAIGRIDTAPDDRAVVLVLAYRVTDHRADETRDVRYAVPLDYTECNFGGVRPWFRCPGPAGRYCGERVGKLYCPPRADRYLCRDCYDLSYRSSRTSGDDLERAEQRYRKAFAKADAENRSPHPNNLPFSPDRPKGMHHDTFEDLVDDVEAAREEWDRAWNRKLRQMNERLAGFIDDL